MQHYRAMRLWYLQMVFRALYTFLQNNFSDIKMYATGKVTVHIYIACNKGSGYVVLHTIGIET